MQDRAHRDHHDHSVRGAWAARAHAWPVGKTPKNRRHGELRHKRKGVCLCVCYELFDVDAFGVCPETAESREPGPMMRNNALRLESGCEGPWKAKFGGKKQGRLLELASL